MNHPPLLYFFPKATHAPLDLVGARVEKLTTKAGLNAIGPEGQRGFLCTTFVGSHVVYNADRQKWTRFSKGGKFFWIGIDQDASPNDFVRKETLPGTFLELEHGLWSIPVANPLVDSCSLPYYDVPDGEGGWYKDYKDKYLACSQKALELAGIAREMCIQSFEGDVVSFEMEDNEIRDYFHTMIGVNYDLTLEEMGALRLFDQAKYLEMLHAFVDVGAMLQMMHQETEAANAPLNPTVAPRGGSDIASGGKESLNKGSE